MATAHDANRVSIGWSFRNELGIYGPTGACPIVNHRRAAEPPRLSATLRITMRAPMSVPPPAGNGTTPRIGREG